MFDYHTPALAFVLFVIRMEKKNARIKPGPNRVLPPEYEFENEGVNSGNRTPASLETGFYPPEYEFENQGVNCGNRSRASFKTGFYPPKYELTTKVSTVGFEPPASSVRDVYANR